MLASNRKIEEYLKVLILSRVCLMFTDCGPCLSACNRQESTRIKEPDLPIPEEKEWYSCFAHLSLEI